MEQAKDFDILEQGIRSGFVRTFATKAAARKAASEFGWSGRVIRIARRFERVWIVGHIHHQPDEVGGIQWDVLHAPKLAFEASEQPVLRCKRLRQ